MLSVVSILHSDKVIFFMDIYHVKLSGNGNVANTYHMMMEIHKVNYQAMSCTEINKLHCTRI